jgi:hypothetical protein
MNDTGSNPLRRRRLFNEVKLVRFLFSNQKVLASIGVAWIAMWRKFVSFIWRKWSSTLDQPCPMTRPSLAAVTISLETISD